MLKITKHARIAWEERASNLKLDPSERAMIATLRNAVIEKPKNRSTGWHLFKRQIIQGETHYIVRDGWRFVVANHLVVTVERVRPEENCLTFSLN